MKYPRPTPEKYQRKARLRRLRQQLRDCKITSDEYLAARLSAEKDYKEWRK